MASHRDTVNEMRNAASDLWEGSDRIPTSHEVHGWADLIESQAARIAELEGAVERLSKPTHYWTDACEDFAVDDPQQIVDEQWIDRAGATFEATPLHAMPKVYYGVVPDEQDDDAEWADGQYCGDLIVVGPYQTELEAKSEADRLTAEAARKAEK